MCASVESFTDGGSGGPVRLNDGRVGGLVWVGWLDLFIHPRECFISHLACQHCAVGRQKAIGDGPNSNAFRQTVCKSASARTISARRSCALR